MLKKKIPAYSWSCSTCSRNHSVKMDDKKLGLVPSSFPCLTMTCKGKLVRSQVPELKWEIELCTATVLYQATQKLGMPEERECVPRRLRKLMVGQKIESISVSPIKGTNRSLIASLTLGNGKVVHLSTSTMGATIFKVTNE